MWAAQFIKYENPKTWLNSGGLGTMGFAVPAAMGAKFGRPEAEVWAIDGDGCFQMTNQELATCAVEGAPIKVAIINNGNLGMVRQWQTLFYEKRYSQTDLGTHSQRIPDFVKLAEALGCVGLRCERAEDVEDVIKQARAINDRPVVIDFIVGADAQVWPMVAAGTSNDEIQAARGIRPLFDDPEDRRTDEHRQRPTHTLSVLVEDKPGVLARVASLFSRRGFNIQSLAVGATEQKDMSRMTIVVSVEDSPLEQITKQLNKLVNVIKIVEQDDDNSVARELALIKVRADASTRSQVIEAVNLFRAKVVDVSTESLTVEATGTPGSSRRCCGCWSRTESERSCSPAWCRCRAARAASAPSSKPRNQTEESKEKESHEWQLRCSTTTTRTCRSSRAARSASSATAARATPTR